MLAPADTTPLLGGDGGPVLSTIVRLRPITVTFRNRFSAPVVNNPSPPRQDSDNVPQQPPRDPAQAPSKPIRILELRMAISNLS